MFLVFITSITSLQMSSLSWLLLLLSLLLLYVGDDVIVAYISGIQFLPVCIMYMRLCPDGAEGASYSMLTTFGNVALVCGSNLGKLLLWVIMHI